MEIEEDVVIVGAGIAGLATALALHRVGVRTIALERSHTLRTTGAALTLSHNAWIAIDALGIADKLTSIYPAFDMGYVTNVATGAVKQILFPGRDKNATGTRTVHRSTLLEALAKELPVDAIRFSSKLSSIEIPRREDTSMVVLRLDDGTIIKAKAVIGCDGVHSVVARWLGLAKPVHSGRYSARGLATFPLGHGLKNEIQQFVDGSTRAGIATLNDKELYWFVTYKSSTLNTGDMTTENPSFVQKKILENLAHFPSLYLDVVRNCDLDRLTWTPLMLRVPWDILYKNMSKLNVTVAGDAMHPMTPDLGQGGCSALEDAIVLGRHIASSFVQHGKIVPEAIREYTEERRWRVAGLITGSYFSGWVQQGESVWVMKYLKENLFYKYFHYFAISAVSYDCGKLLPSESPGEEDVKSL